MFNERIKCLWLGSDGYVACADRNHLSGYFTKDELIQMKNAIDKTLEYYETEGITDDFISHQDKEERDKELKKWEENRNVSKKEKIDDLYIILDEDENHIKIGRSKNVKARLSQLQIANSHRLKLLLTVPKKGYMEADLHETFKSFKVKGEWFLNDSRIIDYIKVFIV